MFDPNSTIPNAHEVRVTMRGVRISETGSPVQVSTRSDFIAPEVSPLSTLAIELDKGLRGWTDYDVKPVDRRPIGVQVFDAKRTALIKARAAAIVADTTCGSVIRKAPVTGMRVVSRTGPRPNRGK